MLWQVAGGGVVRVLGAYPPLQLLRESLRMPDGSAEIVNTVHGLARLCCPSFKEMPWLVL